MPSRSIHVLELAIHMFMTNVVVLMLRTVSVILTCLLSASTEHCVRNIRPAAADLAVQTPSLASTTACVSESNSVIHYTLFHTTTTTHCRIFRPRRLYAMADTVDVEAGPAVTLDRTVLKGVRLTPHWRQEVSVNCNVKADVL